MKNIILAIDFSRETTRLVEIATNFAKQFSADLWLVHVAPPCSTITEIAMSAQDLPGLNIAGTSYYSELVDINETRSRIATELKNQHNQLLEITNRTCQDQVKVRGVILEGQEADKIIDFATKKHADIIIAGSHGHSLIHKAFLGSISEQIIKNSKIPVLIVPNLN